MSQRISTDASAFQLCNLRQTGGGGKSNIFRGGKVIFPDFSMKCFFSVENSHFGWPKTNFSGFEKLKAKNKKKSSICNFSSFHFQFFIFPFSVFFLFCSISPFFLASLFPVGQHKFPGQKSLGGHSAPLPPSCYATGQTDNSLFIFSLAYCNICSDITPILKI